MSPEERLTFIQALVAELDESATPYIRQLKATDSKPLYGYNEFSYLDKNNSAEALNRRITLIREQPLELRKELRLSD